MMPSMDINQRKAALEQERRAHVKAEQERIAAETAHQRRIAELELEIAKEEEAERKARFGEAVQEHNGLVQQNRQEMQALREALPAVVTDLLNTLKELEQPAARSYEQVNQSADRALSMGLSGVEQRAPARVVQQTPTTQGVNEDYMLVLRQEFHSYDQQLAPAVSPRHVFAEAIAREKDGVRRRALIAIYWLRYGDQHDNQLTMFPESFNIEAAAKEEARQLRQRFSGQRILYG